MTQKSDFSIGQKLWYVPIRQWDGEPRPVTITAIGRKWITTDERRGHRFDIETLLADGDSYHSSSGKAYVTREEYENANTLLLAWNAIKSRMNGALYKAPKNLTLENIAALDNALKEIGI